MHFYPIPVTGRVVGMTIANPSRGCQDSPKFQVLITIILEARTERTLLPVLESISFTHNEGLVSSHKKDVESVASRLVKLVHMLTVTLKSRTQQALVGTGSDFSTKGKRVHLLLGCSSILKKVKVPWRPTKGYVVAI